MNDQEYEKMPGIRRSDLWYMNQSPFHFKFHMDNKDALSSPALRFGAAAHKWILEPETFFDEYVIQPDINRRTKEGREQQTRFETMAQMEGKEIITVEDAETIKGMWWALLANPDAVEFLEANGRETERPFAYIDPETQVACKCKADLICTYHGKPYVVDYKTTHSCADGSFERSAREYGYGFQAGFYCEVIESAMLEKYGFAFIAQEKKPPYASRVYICDRGFIDRGKQKFHSLLRLYHNCKSIDEWPGYVNETLYEEGL